ncbi:MAG TPA: bifunctional riboflavin kinase/FAD synthetase [Candidatus Tectomicrobia bacterium]|jgi:riboflavin kinase/FMN adenylyltransferase
MDILDGLEALEHTAYPKPVLALGNFDGVHLGHQAIFHQAVVRAHAIGGTSMVFTFDPHPAHILARDKAPPILTTFAQKMRLIAALGIAVGLRVPFTEAFARQQPIEFIRDVLYHRIGVHDLIVGYDFRFGHRRAGTTVLLQEQAACFGYQVTVVPPITQAGVVVSSSNIRRLLQDGQVEAANRLLGRAYAIEGPVVEGFHRGATLGFPTANVQPVNDIVPRPGVYAVRVEWDGRTYPGVANVGYNPTFGNQALSVEVHLFDFAAALYGVTLRVAFVARLRDERRFASVDELVAQIAHDAQRARTLLGQQTSSA